MEKLGNFISAFIKGKTPKVLYSEKAEGLHPYVSPDYLRGKGNPEFFAAMTNKTIPLEDDEIIILWDGSNAGEVLLSKKGILASTMVKLLVDETKLDKKYFAYSCLNLEYILKAKTAGSGIPHADKGVIKNLPFYFPTDKAEQTAIAKILSTVDEAIRSTRETISKLERVKKSLMQNLLSGKMKPDGTMRPATEFYEDEKMGLVPMGWKCGRFKEFSVLQRGKDLTDKEVVPGKYPVVKSNGVQIWHNEYYIDPPTVVTGRSGTIGKAFYINERCWAHNTSLYVKDFKWNCPKFIYYKIWSMDFSRYFAGTTVPTLNRNDIHKLRVIMPSVEEQNQIVAILDATITKIQQKQEKITALESLKKSLMQQLLTGKVRVK